MAEASPMVAAFAEACSAAGLDVKLAAARVVRLHPELADEFEKAAGLPLLLGLGGVLAGAAAPFLAGGKSHEAPAAPAAQAKPSRTVDEVLAAEGARMRQGPSPYNPYARPGAGGLGPQFYPSWATPPGGFSMYGPGGYPGQPFARNPFSHTVLPPMGKAAAEKEAYGQAILAAGRVGLQRLANSGIGAAVGKGLQSLGGLFNKAPGAPANAVQRVGQAVTTAGADRAQVVSNRAAREAARAQGLVTRGAAATPDQAAAAIKRFGGAGPAEAQIKHYGGYNQAMEAADHAAKANQGWFGRHSGTLMMGGLIASPFLLPSGEAAPQQPQPQPDEGFERQAMALPPTIGGRVKRAEPEAPSRPPARPVKPKSPGAVLGPAFSPPEVAKPPATAVKTPTPPAAPIPAAVGKPPGRLSRLGSGVLRGGAALGGGALAGVGLGQLLQHLAAPYTTDPAGGQALLKAGARAANPFASGPGA